MSPQVQNIIEAAGRYAFDLTGSSTGDMHRMAIAAYVSGVMSASQGLAAMDGVHPSKLAEAARMAGEIMLGIKSSPGKDVSDFGEVGEGKVIKDTGDTLVAANTNASSKPIAGKIPSGKIHVTFARYRTLEFSLETFGLGQSSYQIHDANSNEAKLIAELVKP